MRRLAVGIDVASRLPLGYSLLAVRADTERSFISLPPHSCSSSDPSLTRRFLRYPLLFFLFLKGI